MKADLQSLVQGKKNDTEDTKKGAINCNKTNHKRRQKMERKYVASNTREINQRN